MSKPLAQNTIETANGVEKALVRTRWWWVRHAPVREDHGRIYGQTDLGCDCSEVHVFQALAGALPKGAIWVASHLRRTHQTAAAIWKAGLDAPETLLQERDLAEQHLGDWQGLDRAAFLAGPAPGSHWFAPADERAPNGESFADVVARVHGAVERLSQQWNGRDIVAVAHGGTVKAALAIALGLQPEGGLAFAVDNCSLTRLDHLKGEGWAGWRVGVINHRPWMTAAGGETKLA